MIRYSYYVWCQIDGEKTSHSRSMILSGWFWEKHKAPIEISAWIDKIFIELREKGISPVMKNCGVIKS